MNELQPFLPIFFALVVVAAVLAILDIRRRKNAALLEEVALRRGGRIRRGFLLTFPTLTFGHGGRQVSVHSTPGSRNSPPTTRLTCPLDSVGGFEMRISREGLLSKAFKAFGAQDIEVGNPRFDETFLVKGRDEASVRTLLTPPLQEVLLDLSPRGMHLAVTPGEVKLVVPFIPKTGDEYAPLLDAYLEILDAVLAGRY